MSDQVFRETLVSEDSTNLETRILAKPELILANYCFGSIRADSCRSVA